MSSERLDEVALANDEQMAWKVGKDHHLILQTCDDGWDYTLYDKNFKEIDGGQFDMPELSMLEVRGEILSDFDLGNQELAVVDYDEVVECAEAMEQERIEEYEVDNLAHDLEQFGYDVYGDNQEIIEDCLEVLEPFIDEVMPEEKEEFDLAAMDYMDSVASELVV